MKLASVIVLLALSIAQPARAELLFDRGLPFKHINNEAGEGRSNVRWSAGFDNQNFYGDDFSMGEPGERYRIDHIRTWVVLGYREDDLPAEPGEVGDWFSEVRLLGGLPAAEPLSVLALGELTKGSSVINNSNIELSRVTYPNAAGSNYHNFGRDITVWQLDFYDLNWVVEGGRRYNFSVQGMGRPLEKRDYLHGWYNHATSARYKDSPQQGADNLMLVFNSEGEFVRVTEAEEHWDKPSDINIQIHGEKLADSDAVKAEISNPLLEVLENLYRSELLSDRIYRWLRIEIEQGVTTRKSRLLEALATQAIEVEESDDYFSLQQYVVFSIEDAELSEGILSRLPKFLTDFIVEFEKTHGESAIDGFSAETMAVFLEELEAAHGVNREIFDALIIESVQDFLAEPLETYTTTIKQHLNKLNDTGILDESVHGRLQAAIATQEIYNTIELYQSAEDWTFAMENLQFPYVNERLESLQQVRILSPDNQAKILADLEAGYITNDIQFLEYIEQAAIVRLDKYPKLPYFYLPQLHQEIAQMLYDADILEKSPDIFEVMPAVAGATEPIFYRNNTPPEGINVESQSLDCELFCALAISAQFKNQIYQQAGLYGSLERRVHTYTDSFNGIVDFFNKILRDQDSVYRLYHLKLPSSGRLFSSTSYEASSSEHIEDTNANFIVLTEAQAEAFFNDAYFRATGNVINSEFRDDQPGLQSNTINEIVNIMESSGLFSELEDSQITAGKSRIAQSYLSQGYEILEQFDNVLYIPFAEDSEELLSDQERLILGFANVSRGTFQPSQIQVSYDQASQTQYYAFELDGDRYRNSFQFTDDYGDYDWEVFIESVISFIVSLADSKIPSGRFYEVLNEYQTPFGYIFLTDTQYDALDSYELLDIQPMN
ncbi:hypothetical protein Lepto7375DRAFT_6488 [Leptolyngbya sp. PCC 7375]|nr:hypothetical protein Lepto7375DRAFT_6488 [Leptolyngbya sp. PCC 7375]